MTCTMKNEKRTGYLWNWHEWHSVVFVSWISQTLLAVFSPSHLRCVWVWCLLRLFPVVGVRGYSLTHPALGWSWYLAPVVVSTIIYNHQNGHLFMQTRRTFIFEISHLKMVKFESHLQSLMPIHKSIHAYFYAYFSWSKLKFVQSY